VLEACWCILGDGEIAVRNFHQILLTAALLMGGCGGGLQLELVNAAYRKPSNVAVFFSVETADGEPVADLVATDFKIYEDDVLVSVDESRQTIVSPEIVAEHYALLLVDMSASVTESDKIPVVVQSVSDFVEKVGRYQRVGVYAFDGSADLHEIMPFTPSEQENATREGVARLGEFRARDPSTNLHGAVVQAVEELDRAIKRSRAPQQFGTLVVFTDGTDHAARVSFEKMVEKLDQTGHATFAIGVGNEIDDATLQQIGRDRYIRVEDRNALSEAFQQIGSRIVDLTRRYYLLSYCSPARAGKHEVKIEAVSEQGNGELGYSFDARGFTPGCDPGKPPPFSPSRSVRKKLKRESTPEKK
jgi:hypothetical protein